MISHQGKATQNPSEIPLHVLRMTKRRSKQVLERVVEKLNLSYSAGEDVAAALENGLAVSLEFKHRVTI